MSENKPIPNIKKAQEAYVFEYPQAIEFARKQNSIFWLEDEIKVEKDKQDLLVNMTASETHGTITNLKLFTKYELFVGNEYWGGVIAKRYPRPEIQRMANAFAFFELNVHAPFYSRINEVLGLASEEFYNSYVDDPILKDRMDFIDSMVDNPDELLSLAAFSMIEGAVLYSAFAFLKHFQSKGKNRLINIVRGINFSVRDENIHSEAGAWLFRTHLSEAGLTPEEIEVLFAAIYKVAEKILEHEYRIIDMVFEKGPMENITALQMKHFVDSRVNLCLERLGLKKIREVKYNPIADWFYDGINSYTFNDFFSGIGNQYSRGWDESAFIWGQAK